MAGGGGALHQRQVAGMTGYLAALVEDAAREAGCTVAQILGPQHRFAPYRHRAMRAAAAEGYSLPQIGRAFNRDHSTVFYAVRKCS
jgi:chromosomal replication initiation ATPase DnaA